jgi:hypothetical protein
VPKDDLTAGTIRGTYQALVLGGLAPGEAANVTAFLHGLPSAGIRWTVAEVEAIVRRRADHVRSADVTLDELAFATPLPWIGS